MSRPTHDRFADILGAIDRCADYRPDLASSDSRLASMAQDAVLRNLAVIGEAVRMLPAATKAAMPDIPWSAIAGLRNVVIHEYFRIDPQLIIDIVDTELGPLADALRG